MQYRTFRKATIYIQAATNAISPCITFSPVILHTLT